MLFHLFWQGLVTKMAAEIVYIEIDGEEIADVYADLSSVEVELDDELASMFRLRISIALESDGQWTYLDDERFQVWKSVIINAGFEQADELLMDGFITHVKPMFGTDPAQVFLDVWGMDKSVLLDREEKLKDWPNKKDSDIATEIFNEYGLTPEVEDSTVVHDEVLSTVIQRETDMQFLKRLALRNGYECYVHGTTGYFRSPQIDDDPQPVLAAHFGTQTTLSKFNVDVNALSPSNVAMFQIDRANKETIEVAIESSDQTALGDTDASGLLALGMEPAKNYIAKNGASGNPEMSALCQGLFHRSEWFVTADGEVDANLYNHVLLPRATVTIKGVGETYSGIYYVSHVNHVFYAAGYIQRIKVKRNGLLPTGDENFDFDSGGLLGAIGL